MLFAIWIGHVRVRLCAFVCVRARDGSALWVCIYEAVGCWSSIRQKLEKLMNIIEKECEGIDGGGNSTIATTPTEKYNKSHWNIILAETIEAIFASCVHIMLFVVNIFQK